MDGFDFLFTREGTPPDDSPYNSDASGIDEETSNYLYSQIYYDTVSDDESSSKVVEVVPSSSADEQADVSTEVNGVLTSTPAAKDRIVPLLNNEVTPITNDKAVPTLNIDAKPDTSKSAPQIEKEVCKETPEKSVGKSKPKKEKKGEQSKKAKDTGAEKDLQTKSTKKHKKDKTDKTVLDTLLLPIVLSDSNSETQSKPARKKSKTKKTTADELDYSDSESKSRSISTISKTNVGASEIKTPKSTLGSDSESSDVSAESKSDETSKSKKSKDSSRKRKKKHENDRKAKKKKLYTEHVTIISDSDDDEQKIRVSDEDIIEIDSDLHDKIIDISDDSYDLSDDGAGMDSIQINTVSTPKTNGKVSLLYEAKSAQNSPSATTPNRSMPARVSMFDTPLRSMEDAFKGLHVNMGHEDSQLVKSINEGMDLSGILDALEDCDWSTDYRPSRKSSNSSRYYTNVSATGRRPVCQKCNIVHLSESECKKRERTCHICCEKGHFSSSCPRVLCNRCHAPDHRRNDCPNTMSVQCLFCKRCQMKGHKQEMCPDIWRQYHATTNGSIVPVRPKKSLPNPNRSCANCASTQHFVHDCPKKLPSNLFIQYPMVARYDKREEIEQRARRNTQLPKQLKYIDAEKEEREQNGREEHHKDSSRALNGSDLVARALQSSEKARGQPFSLTKESQKMRRNNGGDNPKKWAERVHTDDGGSQQRSTIHTSSASTPGVMDSYHSSSTSGQKSSGKNNRNMEDRGFKRSQTLDRFRQSKGFKRSNALNSTWTPSEKSSSEVEMAAETSAKRSQSEHRGSKGSTSIDSSTSGAKRSRSEDNDVKRTDKSSEELSSQGASTSNGELQGYYHDLLKTAPQTTQKLNTMKNQLKREKKERNRERKEKFLKRSELNALNTSGFCSTPNSETPKKNAKKSKVKNPWLPTKGGDFKSSLESKSTGNKNGMHKRKNSMKNDHIHVRNPNKMRDSSTDRQAKDNSTNRSQTKKKMKKPIYLQ